MSALSTAPEAEQQRFVMPSFAPSMPTALAPVDHVVKHAYPVIISPERTPLPDLPTAVTVPVTAIAPTVRPVQHKSSFEAPHFVESAAQLVKSTRGALDANVAPVIVSQSTAYQASPAPTREPNYVIGVYR